MNLDTHKIKYVIAREGLVIVSLLIGVTLSYYADSWQKDRVDSYSRGAEEVELVQKGAARGYLDNGTLPPKGVKYTPVSYDPFVQPTVQFPRSTPDDVIKRTVGRDYPNNIPSEWVPLYKTNAYISTRYDVEGDRLFTGLPWNIDFQKVMIFFLFIAYPAYLLIRFIVWAIVTVKKPCSAHS